ncbi:hypothetical protein CC86DRAFT_371722 [Ophiobolus disseminans]|uniref:WSC domain-containing protein n=1 Tax=Ophiobolus disseminans TaxID=1469910 RepID=A0A6A6ZTH5_9PLEO|nr:hypothetical protein CC86DRAFT_371722 [Ophiobolus disseminans]
MQLHIIILSVATLLSATVMASPVAHPEPVPGLIKFYGDNCQIKRSQWGKKSSVQKCKRYCEGNWQDPGPGHCVKTDDYNSRCDCPVCG